MNDRRQALIGRFRASALERLHRLLLQGSGSSRAERPVACRIRGASSTSLKGEATMLGFGPSEHERGHPRRGDPPRQGGRPGTRGGLLRRGPRHDRRLRAGGPLAIGSPTQTWRIWRAPATLSSWRTRPSSPSPPPRAPEVDLPPTSVPESPRRARLRRRGRRSAGSRSRRVASTSRRARLGLRGRLPSAELRASSALRSPRRRTSRFAFALCSRSSIALAPRSKRSRGRRGRFASSRWSLRSAELVSHAREIAASQGQAHARGGTRERRADRGAPSST